MTFAKQFIMMFVYAAQFVPEDGANVEPAPSGVVDELLVSMIPEIGGRYTIYLMDGINKNEEAPTFFFASEKMIFL